MVGQPRGSWKLSHRAKRLVAVPLVLALMTGVAWAYWSASSVPGGNGASAATSVNQGATPTASASGSAVTVSWSATTLASGQAVSGYLVTRYDAITPFAAQSILSACTGTITALSCVESSVPTGSWKYTVTPKFATNWQGVESLKSNTVVVDSVAPTNSITLSNVTGGAYLSTNNIFYRGTAAGSFTLTNAVADATSGPASSATATMTGTSTGWTHTPSTVSTPAGGPYVSNAFSWSAATTTTPGEVVTGADVSGNTAGTTLTTTLDNTAPSAGTVTPDNGYVAGRSVNVAFTTGTDGGSGLGTRQLQRASATLTAGTCGSYSTFTSWGPADPTSPYSDTEVSNGHCYQYKYAVTDNVGNQHLATSGNVAKVDYANAVNATTGLVSQWRLGETTPSSDTFTDTTGTLLSAHAPETGTSWTRWVNDTITGEITNANRVRKTNVTGGVGYYTAAVPASANYLVEADVHVKSITTGDHIGIIGRWDITDTTGGGTYYLARYDTATGAWQLLKSVSGTATLLGTAYAQTLTAGVTYRLGLDMSGTTIRLLVDGVQRNSAVDASVTAAGRAGVRLGASGDTVTQSDTLGLQLDNLAVTQTAIDSKGTNHGSYFGVPTLGVAGAINGDANTAAQFDGSTEYASVARQISDDLSIEFWFKSTQSFGSGCTNWWNGAGMVDAEVNGAYNDFGVSLCAGKVIAGIGSPDMSIVSASGKNDGNWHHVVLSRTKATGVFSLYVDGASAGSATGSTASLTSPANINFGRLQNGTNYFAGTLDEIGVYNTALSATTVTNHYQLGTALLAPVVTATGSTLAYTENATPLLDSAITATDADSANLTSATVTMTTAYVSGQDTLAFTDQNGITGTWTGATGVLALTGTATVAQYQTALRSITYNNNSDNPTTTTRTVTFVANDGSLDSNTASRTITLTAVNDAPVLAATGSSLAYTENGTTALDAGITATDADNTNLSSATVTMTTAYVNGQDTLAFSNQNGITGTWTAATGVLALSGSATVANYQTALRSITYNNNSDNPDTTTRTVTFVANDGALNSNTASRTITLTAVNDAPVNSIPGAQSTSTQTPKVFSSGNGNLISISDSDASAAAVQVQLVSTNGTTTLSGFTGLTFGVGDGTADATMTFTGTIANINAALAGLTFTPTAAGATTLQIVTSDQGNTGIGGTLTDDDTISFGYGLFTTTADIGAGAAGPTSSAYSGSTYTEVGNGLDIGGGTSDQYHYLYKPWTGDGTIIARVTSLGASSTSAKASVMFRETTAVGSVFASMTIKPTAGNTVAWIHRDTTDATTGTSTTTGTPIYWLRVVRSGNTFTGYSAPDSSGSPGTWTQLGTQSITMAGTILVGLGTTSRSTTLTTTGIYDNVSLAAPAAPVLTATGSTLAYTENATPLLDSAITATDADSANLSSATVTMTTAYVNGEDTLAFTNQNGITGTWTAGTGVLALTGSATVAQYQTALRSITYNNNSNAPTTTTRTVTFVASDGALNSNTSSRTITLTAVNDAPLNSVPGAQTLTMNTPLVFSSGNGNLISISDSDAGSSPVQVQLTATNATLTLSGTTGLTFTAGNGTADTTMTFTGTITNVNLSLAGMSSTTTAAGPVTVQIITSDQGSTGTGGTLSDSDTVTATFLTYPFEVNGDSPWAFLRGEEAPSSAATSTATDTSANTRPGTYAGPTNGPSTRWALTEGSGTVAADSSGAANPGTIGSGNTWLTDRTDKVLNFSGTTATTGYVQSAAPAVRTDASFTVSAWVNTTTGTGFKTAVSQIGTNTSGFYLQLDNTGKWAFNLPRADTTGSTGDIVQSSVAAATNTWTHLTGVYDDAANTSELYVNGVSQGTVAHTDANEWNATGLMQAGRAWWNTGFVDAWAGKLDDVRTYRRALSATEVSSVYGDAPSLAYDLEENTGTTTADRSGLANTGTIGAGAVWTTAGHSGNALQFDNTATDYAQSAAAPIDTTASFTVSTWVNMNSGGAATKSIISQQGVNESTLILKLEGTGKWGYSLATTSLGAADQVLSSSAAATNTWVHLVAVYDSAAAAGSKMRLYVNGSLSVSGAHATTYGTTNPLQLSRTRYGGAWVDPFDGEIDDVRTYRRALTTTEITNLYTPTAEAGMTAGVPGALQGAQQGQQATTAIAFAGTANAYNNTSVASPGPTAFTLECWFKASGSAGGQLMGFASDQTGITSASRDRMVYLDSGNKLTFGTWPVSVSRTVRSTVAYNDGAWHHLAASLGAAGLKLYVDGALIVTDATTTTAGSYTGYWRWGGGNIGSSWPNQPSNFRFTGSLDEVAVFSSQLTDTQIAEHYYSNH